MVKKVIWSNRAKNSFDRVIAYLQKDWTEKEIIKFVNQTSKTIDIIQSGVVTHRSSGKKEVFEVLITKHNLLIYKVSKLHYELLVFYDTRQHPKKKRF
ncbi:hypothetical protein MASR2M44_03590 [Bacteroidota bacterium]